MREIKQSAAANVMVFMADSTDHVTGKTGLTLTVTISKDGAAFGSISPTVTERGNGWYNVALVAGDTGMAGDLVVRATSTGADPGERTLNVVANVEADTYGRVGAAGAGLTALGDTRIANLDATVSSRLASSGYTTPDNTTIGTINTKLGTPAGASVSADMAAVKSDSGTILTRVPSEVAQKSHLVNGTGNITPPTNIGIWDRVDAAITSRASATDYTTARAAKIDNLDVSVGSRLAASGYTAPDNTTIGFIQKWILNKLVEGPANTWKLYDDDSTTVMKTWTWDSGTTTRSKAV